MQWTTQRPEVAGWYWFRPGDDTPLQCADYYDRMASAIERPVIVLVSAATHFQTQEALLAVKFPRGTWFVREMGGHFAGPIEPPRN